jgi:lipopolysaccharide transport system permease protein
MGAAGGLVTGNAAYVKTLAFPLEVLSVSSVLNILMNMGISLLICLVAHLVMYGFLHASTISLVIHIVCITLLGLGISWFVSALSVFVRDVPAVIPPISIVLMFISGVFFPLSNISPRARWIFELNPLAVIIDQARGALMYGHWPDPVLLGSVFAVSALVAIGGHSFFMRTKPAFADVL